MIDGASPLNSHQTPYPPCLQRPLDPRDPGAHHGSRNLFPTHIGTWPSTRPRSFSICKGRHASGVAMMQSAPEPWVRQSFPKTTVSQYLVVNDSRIQISPGLLRLNYIILILIFMSDSRPESSIVFSFRSNVSPQSVQFKAGQLPRCGSDSMVTLCQGHAHIHV